MIFTRQKIVLAILEKHATVCERIRLVKLVFLLRDLLDAKTQSTFYSFVPHKYGPFSFGLYHDLNKLLEKKLIVESDEGWSVNTFSPVVLRREESHAVERLFRNYDSWNTEAIVDHVYEKHPWFTARAKDHSRRKANLPKVGNAVYTSGYEEMQVDEFLNSLLRAGIEVVIDTRANPVSRRYGFHKSTLSQLAINLGLVYHHLPQVGISSRARRGLGESLTYEELFRVYRQSTLVEEAETVAEICELVSKRPTVLICSERCASCCHRLHLAELVAKRTGLEQIELRQQ